MTWPFKSSNAANYPSVAFKFDNQRTLPYTVLMCGNSPGQQRLPFGWPDSSFLSLSSVYSAAQSPNNPSTFRPARICPLCTIGPQISYPASRLGNLRIPILDPRQTPQCRPLQTFTHQLGLLVPRPRLRQPGPSLLASSAPAPPGPAPSLQTFAEFCRVRVFLGSSSLDSTEFKPIQANKQPSNRPTPGPPDGGLTPLDHPFSLCL